MTLRAKLLLSLTPLALALLLLGIAAAHTLGELGSSPAVMLARNDRSVLAAERLLAALARLQDHALARATGRAPPPGPPVTELLGRGEDALDLQEHNLTEPGEPEATARLRRSWQAYRAALEAPGAGAGPADLDALTPAAAAVRAAAEEVLGLNQDAMARRSGQARRAAGRALDVVAIATAAALALGLVSSLTLTARLLRPLRALALSVRRVAEGDLGARARVVGRDEIADLAREFNAMTDRLAGYRRSSLGELLQAQQAAQAAIDSLPDPVLVLGAAGVFLNVNGAAEALLHVAAEAGVDALPPELRAVVDRAGRHALAGRGAYLPRGLDEAVRMPTPDGERLLLPRATPLYDEGGAVGAATVVLQDVTRLLRLDELKDDLVAAVAHELRTPLTSLRMAVHLLAEERVGPLNPRQADLAVAAREESERLQGIVDDLLDLSRLQAGRAELDHAPVPAGPLLAQAATERRPAAEAAGLALEVRAAPEPLAAAGDRERLLLVLRNLVENAIRHTPPGGRITLSAAPEGERLRFAVQDTGEGIAPELQERIFEKYYRIPGTKPGGVGLGLYLSRQVVHAHGGEMGVQSAPGQGSTFWFTLPAAHAPADAAPAVATHDQRP